MRMGKALHHCLRTLAGYQKISLSNLILNLITDALQERRRNEKLPGWMETEEFIRAIEEE
jgi:hypothetical protein